MTPTPPSFRAGRLLLQGSAAGGWNMAVDEVLLEHSQPGTVCMRLYGWEPATLSLGYFQAVSERAGHEPSLACPLVRRASGGGAILHDRELTYSLVVPRSNGGHLDTQWVYDLVHDSLRSALRALGIETEKCTEETRTDPQDPHFLCFQRHCPGDLLMGPHKVVGSAQRRSRDAVLQHGSILLGKSPYAPELPGITDLAPDRFSLDSFQAQWLQSVAERLALEWRKDNLTAQEAGWVKEKQVGKFASANWTNRR